MRIVFDLTHPAHVNFFKHAIRRLNEEGNDILVLGLKRGVLPRIITREFGGYNPEFIGVHRGTKLSIILDANIKRFFRIFFYLRKKHVHLGLAHGFVLGTALRCLNVRNLQFDDDPERRVKFLLEKLTSTQLFLPVFGSDWNGACVFRALKEWAYLSPSYFKPDEGALQRRGVQRKRYLFVREVSTATLNYARQRPGTVATFARLLSLPAEYRVILSLEDKSTRDWYPAEWILLEEPVDDIHSLMYHSTLVIASGDSMAREGAMLGVPSIYCGTRDMAANRVMIDRGMLFKVVPYEVPNVVGEIMVGTKQIEEQTAFRNALLEDWEDVTERIVTEVHRYEP